VSAHRRLLIHEVRVATLASALALFGSVAAHAADTAVRIDCADGLHETITLPTAGSLRVVVAHNTPVVVEVVEAGIAVEIDADVSLRVSRIAAPPRLRHSMVAGPAGSAFALRRTVPDASAAPATVTVRCHSDDGARIEAWYAEAVRATAGLDGWVGGALPAGIDAALADLHRRAYSDGTRALAQHLQAQAQLVSGKSSDAADRFVAVAQAWAALGDDARAEAARVAAAEDYNRAARYADTLALTASAAVGPASGYYATRLVNARCLALRYGGRLDEASDCYRATTARLAALREDVELAVTTIDFGTIELQRGRVDEARVLFDRSLGLLVGERLDDERGRARFFLAEADARSGRIAAALANLDAAAFHFERSGSTRWSASTLLRLSALLADFGAVVDARAAVDAALVILAGQQAPARLAAAHLARARIALQELDHAAALADATQARAIYAELGMPIEADLAGALLARIHLAAGATAAARPLIDTLKQLDDVEKDLLRAELAVAEGDAAAVASALAALDPARLAIAQRVRWERVDARRVALIDGPAAGLRRLREHADRWRRIAQGMGNLALRDRVSWIARGIEAMAVDDIARSAAPQAVDATRMQADLDVLGIAVELGRGVPKPQPANADATLSATLLPAVATLEARDTRASRELLERLAATRESATRPLLRVPARALSAIAVRNGRDLLVLDDGHAHVIARLFRSDAQVRSRVIDRRAWSNAVEALIDALARPEQPVGAIAARAAAVAGLLPELDAERLQAGLQVFPGRAWTDVPWSVLYAWQGDRPVDPPISVARLVDAVNPESRPPRAVEVHVAAQLGGRVLPALDAATVEASLIDDTLATLAVSTRNPTSPQHLLQAFAEPGAWVHVAAHGKAAAGRVGGGGIWLDPARAQDPPVLLSAFDVLEQRSAAALVVLNACDLGREGDRRAQAGSFADALLATGTSQVVAALWPVSDGAARIWVSAFYRRIDGASPRADVAAAAARAALRASRAYRHPHYWGGLTHFTVSPVGVSGN
jgi:hypothetical protein